jgi:hypothetical protein
MSLSPRILPTSTAVASPGVESVFPERGWGTVKGMTLIGIALIILGVIALPYQGITYTTREKIVDVGPAQLCGLEWRTARGRRDSIDYAPGAHDDLANAAAGALLAALRAPASLPIALV